MGLSSLKHKKLKENLIWNIYSTFNGREVRDEEYWHRWKLTLFCDKDISASYGWLALLWW